MPEHACFILLLTIELQIPHAQSLKDKRQQLRSLKEHIYPSHLKMQESARR